MAVVFYKSKTIIGERMNSISKNTNNANVQNKREKTITLLRIIGLVLSFVFVAMLALPGIGFSYDLKVSHWQLFGMNNGWFAIAFFILLMLSYIIVDDIVKLSSKNVAKSYYAKISSIVKVGASALLFILCVVPPALNHARGLDFVMIQGFFSLSMIAFYIIDCINTWWPIKK